MRILSLLLSCVSAVAMAQQEDCLEALETAAKIKSDLRLENPDLKALQYKIKQQTQSCGDIRELWELREQVAARLGDQADRVIAANRLKRFGLRSSTEAESTIAGAGVFNPAARVKAHWALVAGTGEFPKVPGKSLEFASHDLKAVKEMLSSWGYASERVLTATGKDFTRAKLEERIAELRKHVGEEDLVFVYILTHGMETEEDSNSSSVLLTAETDSSTEQSRFATGIRASALVQELFTELKAQRVVILLDTCFSGDAINQKAGGGRFSPRLLELLTMNSGRVIVSASQSDQRSFELRKASRGAFSYCWTEAAKASGSTQSVSELFQATDACVEREVAKLGQGLRQRPAMHASEAAKRLLLLPAK